MLKNNRGFTLVELVVVMAIFITVLIVASSGFKTVLTQVGQQSKQMETDIGSVVGLEVFRSDLQNAGYGLPWAFQHTPSAAKYTEVVSGDSGTPMTASFWPSGQSPLTYNDAGVGDGVPRAVLSGATTFNGGSKYLVIKSLSVASSSLGTQKKTVQVSYSGARRKTTTWGDSTRDFQDVSGGTERVIVLRNTFIDRVPTRELQVNGGNFSAYFKQNQYTTLTLPHSAGDMFAVYGVDAATEPRMPFNRADYYVYRPVNPPPACAPNTGVLYKAVVNQGGGFSEMSLLDCVADMEVVYGLAQVGSKDVTLHQTTLPGVGTSTQAQAIREQLKEIRVYILAHNGKKDTGYSHPDSIINVGEDFGGGLQGRAFNLATQIGAGWQNYRWKLYTIVVRPQNLIQ